LQIMPYRCWYIWPKTDRRYPLQNSRHLLAYRIGICSISSKLRAAGFILAVRGPSGGLKIFKNPDEISLYDVILSMEGVVQTGKICGLPSDELEQEMVTLETAYQRLNILLERELKKIMLSDII